MNSICSLLGLVVFASGCVTASVETTRLNTPPHPLVSRPARTVELYSSSAPTRPHVDVALLRAKRANVATDTPRMVQWLVERAGQLGCDALFISGNPIRTACATGPWGSRSWSAHVAPEIVDHAQKLGIETRQGIVHGFDRGLCGALA